MSRIKLFIILLILFPLLRISGQEKIRREKDFRPPSVPLVTHDPYFSIWSPADRLTDSETVHWTGARQPLHCLIRIDGKSWRVMENDPSRLEPMKQTDLTVFPTRTIYKFANSRVQLTLTFLTPALPNDPDVLSRPVTYLSFKVKSLDGNPHDVQLYFDAGSELVVNNNQQTIQWEQYKVGGLEIAKTGATEQDYLSQPGDNVRIDWGYAYLAVPGNQKATISVGKGDALRNHFIEKGILPQTMIWEKPVKVSDGFISWAAMWNAGKIDTTSVTHWAMLGYDDIYSIRYFDDDLQAWWKRNGLTMNDLLQNAARDFQKLNKECKQFDKELLTDLEQVGGKKYAQMCALVYRQSLAAHKLVADKNGMPLFFSKENFSNGCIGTVDVIYPFSPFSLLFSPMLTKAMLQPLLDYSASPRWKFPFAPHDMGTYPYATGQVYGGGEDNEENQMPVEETGNMIIMLAALAQAEGNADFANRHWPVLEKWAQYLPSKGFDPENQLCTDDFAGHLAHNINLSAKAIVAIASYSRLCEMTGRKADAINYRLKAENMVKEWVKLSAEDNHTRLAFDKPGTWSQKYNLVWDKLLNLNLFPDEVVKKEIEFYKTVQAEYGLPLDSRERYTKNDWITWTATLSDNREDFKEIFNPIWKYADETPDRVPLSDWYIVDNAQKVGFQARSVVGGFFVKMLDDETIWKKWVSKGTNISGSWAPLNMLKLGKTFLPTAKEQNLVWKITTEKPLENWMNPGFDDSAWQSDTAAFGSPGYGIVKTVWESENIWIRKEFIVKDLNDNGLALLILYNDEAEVFINGKQVGSYAGALSNHRVVKLGAMKNYLQLGKNLIAIHCRWTANMQAIDAGLAEYALKEGQGK